MHLKSLARPDPSGPRDSRRGGTRALSGGGPACVAVKCEEAAQFLPAPTFLITFPIAAALN